MIVIRWAQHRQSVAYVVGLPAGVCGCVCGSWRKVYDYVIGTVLCYISLLGLTPKTRISTLVPNLPTFHYIRIYPTHAEISSDIQLTFSNASVVS